MQGMSCGVSRCSCGGDRRAYRLFQKDRMYLVLKRKRKRRPESVLPLFTFLLFFQDIFDDGELCVARQGVQHEEQGVAVDVMNELRILF